MSFTKSVLAFGSLTALLALAPAARATECEQTSDCAKGFTCILPPTLATPVAAPACPNDADCAANPPVPVRTGSPTPTHGTCEPGSCVTDADCGTGMLCHTSTATACSGGTASACAKGTECPSPPASTEPVCTETKSSTCAYRWELPCNTDSDCGDAFTCEPSISGSCSGGGAAGTAGTTSGGGSGPSAPGGTAPTPPRDMCTTTTSFPGWCAPKVTTCKVDTDCPAAWTCAATPPEATEPVATSGGGTGGSSGTSTTGAAGTTSSTGAAGTAAATPADTGAPNAGAPASTSTPAQPATTTMSCTPPGFTRGDGGGTVTVGGTPEGTGATPSVPGASGNKGGDAVGMAPTGSPSAAAPDAGCAVGGHDSGSSVGWTVLGLLALVLARRRR